MKYAFNPCSERWLGGMPKALRDTVMAMQEGIETAVLRSYPGAIATSGVRCPVYNATLPGASAHSLHILGCARDYRLDSMDGSQPIPGVRVMKHRDHWHVEVI